MSIIENIYRNYSTRKQDILDNPNEWKLINNWWICYPGKEQFKELVNVAAEWYRLELTKKIWCQRLAHVCENGKITAPHNIYLYKKKDGTYSIKGKCRKCGAPLPEELEAAILLNIIL